MAGKYGYPYFANFLNSDMDPSDVRSMCPLDGNTEIFYYSNRLHKFVKSQIKTVYKNSLRDNIEVIRVLSQGREVDCRINEFNIPSSYEIELVNGLKFKTTENHLNKVYGKDYVESRDLTLDDYLPISLIPYEKNKSLSYDDGMFIGMYLGDGSKDKYSVTFSLNRDKKQSAIDFIKRKAVEQFGAYVSECDLISSISGKSSCVNIKVNSKYLLGLINQFVVGNDSLTKGLDYSVFNQSIDFRNGVLDGLYVTDGGNKNRIYTASERLKDDIVLLCATLGIPCNISKDDREGRLSDKTCYTIRYYNFNGRQSYHDIYKIDDKNKIAWFKIKTITKNQHPSSTKSYCLEVINDNEEPVFMLSNGILTHNCRLRLDLTELRKRNGGLFGSGDSTGSIGVVTISLPKIAYESKGNKEEFYNKLNEALTVAKDSLEIKRKWLQENVIDNRLIPAFCTYVGTMDNHFSTIGIVGMNEMCENFFGEGIDISTDTGKQFSIEVGNYIRDKLVDFQQETGRLYNFEATPAEATAYSLAVKNQKTYPNIITRGTKKAPYYTNSCHLPVSKQTSIKQIFDNQDNLQVLFTGGTVIHIWLKGAISSEAAKDIIKTCCENYKVPYISLSPLNRYCPEHGYIADDVEECPICHKAIQKYQRITGYLRCVDNYNDGKKAEFEERTQINYESQI